MSDSISSDTLLGLDCRAAIRAAEVITLDFSFSSNVLSFFGITLGMMYNFVKKC